MTRQHLGLVFGGRSAEHEVSIESARCILEALDPERYRVSPLAIDVQGRWWLGDPGRNLEDAFGGTPVFLPGTPSSGLLVTENGSGKTSQLELDVAFPVVHGSHGEDGTLQGLLELAEIPYVGSGVLSSALQMDKDVAKRLLKAEGIPVVPGVVLRDPLGDSTSRASSLGAAIDQIGFPAFVKPANSGSSLGTSRVEDAEGLTSAVAEAFRFDTKVLVERAIDAREIEVAVIGNDRPRASVPGEILCSRDFYDYDAKYSDTETKLQIPAEIPNALALRMEETACHAFRTLDAAGLARVDFLLDRQTQDLYVNELNSLPGFTRGSMFPRLWEATGMSFSDQLDRLIELALERHARRSQLAHNTPG